MRELGEQPYSPIYPPEEFTIYAGTVLQDEGQSQNEEPKPGGRKKVREKRKSQGKRKSSPTAELGPVRSQSDGADESENVMDVDPDSHYIMTDEYGEDEDREPTTSSRMAGRGLFENVNRALNSEFAIIRISRQITQDANDIVVGWDVHPENTGFWICGAGHSYVLPPKFNDPKQKAKFITRLIFMFFVSLLCRWVCLYMAVLEPVVHDFLYENNAFGYPPFICLLTYFCINTLLVTRWFVKSLKTFPIILFLFVLQECMRTICYCLFSLAFEYVIIYWYDTLDIHNDYDPTQPGDRNYWKELVVTPPIMFLIMVTGVMINIFTALCLEVHTDMKLGSREMYRATALTSFMCFVVSAILIRFYSIGLIPMWDGFQIVLGNTFCITKTWMFLFSLDRMVTGRIVFLEGMTNKDALFALLVIA